MIRVLPIRLVSSAWPRTLLSLCEPVWLRSSRLSRIRAPPACSANCATSVMMLGRTLPGLRTYDTMRTVDYLLTRPECDPKRIDEVRQLLRRAGRLEGRLRPHTWQTLIGLLACTGLRISEATHLRPSDVIWTDALLIIRESKYGKTRLVPLHPTALAPLWAYDRRRQKQFPLAQYFFVSEQGNRLAPSTVDGTFSRLRKGIPSHRRPPRLHDFRHTMASQVLQRWLASRQGAVNRVLILSRYLGHGHVEDTYWYLTALPQLLADAGNRIAVSEHEDS